MSEFEVICRRIASMPPSQLRSDALDLVGALRAQALLTTEMAATAQVAQNEYAALRQELAAATARAEAAERRLVDASELVYDLIGELADATGRSRTEIEAAFLGEVQP